MATLAPWKGFVKENLLRLPAVRDTLSPELIETCCRQAGHQWRASFWNPSTTILTFLLQVLEGAKTLRAAVATLLTPLAAQGERPLPSPDPTAYCQARRRLPMPLILRLLLHLTRRMRTLVTPATGWQGRRVWVVDGSSASMPDTPAPQKAFPQPPGQKKGCGFPVAQFVALFRLHQRRKADFRGGRRLGHDDRLVVWCRPQHGHPA